MKINRFTSAALAYNAEQKKRAHKIRSNHHTTVSGFIQQEIDDIDLKYTKIYLNEKNEYSEDEMKALICEHRLNVYFIMTGEGVMFNLDLNDKNIKFLEMVNEILLKGIDPAHLLKDLKLSRSHFNRFWTNDLSVKDAHWAGLITEHDVSPLYAFLDREEKYINA